MSDSERIDRLVRLVFIGFILTLTLSAVVLHLDYALSLDGFVGRDWTVHPVYCAKAASCGLDPICLAKWYRETPLVVIHYPPVFYVTTGLFARALGLDLLTAMIAAQAVWIALLAALLYGIGRRVGDGAYSGAVAASLGALSGPALEWARDQSLEYPTMVAAALVLYGAARAMGYESRARSALFGLCVGIAILVKTVVFAFAFPLALVLLLLPPGSDPRPWRERLAGAGIAAAVCLAVSGWYYLPLLSKMLTEMGGEAHEPLATAALNAGFYWDLAAQWIFARLHLVLGAAALGIAVWKRDRFVLAVCCGAAGYVALLLGFESVAYSYLYPLVVCLAVLVARALGSVPEWLRVFAALVLVLLYGYIASLPLIPVDGSSSPQRRAMTTFTHPMSPRTGGPAMAPAEPKDMGAEPYFVTRRLLQTRYAEYGYDDIGILDLEMLHPLDGFMPPIQNRGTGAVRAALAMARTDPADRARPADVWSAEMSGRTSQMEGEMPDQFFLAERPLVIVLWPEEVPVDRSRKVAEAMAGTHRLDAAVSYSFFERYRSRVLFFVAEEPVGTERPVTYRGQ